MPEPSDGRRRLPTRPRAALSRRVALAGLALAAVALLLGPRIVAQARAATVLGTVLEAPALSAAVRILTRRPVAEERVVAGTPTTVVRPGGDGPWPAIVFVNGATPEGHLHPTVQRLARGLACAGYLVMVPELPGLRDGVLGEAALRTTLEVSRAASDRGDVRGGRVGLVGVSTGATLALLAAQHPELGRRVSVVSGVAPYSDIRNVLRIATTGTYRQGRTVARFRAEPFVALVAARSLAAALPAGRDRAALTQALDGVDPDSQTPLADARLSQLPGLGAHGRAVTRLLLEDDPRGFDRRYARLPAGVRAAVERLSPLHRRAPIRAPVELVSAPRDKYFPLHESRALRRIAARHRLTVTAALAHADPVPSLARLGDLARLNGYVVRSLQAASR